MATAGEYFLGSVAIFFSLTPNLSPRGEGSDYRQGDEDGVGVGAGRPYIPTAYATIY